MKNRLSPRAALLALCLAASATAVAYRSPSASGQGPARVRQDLERVLTRFDRLTLDPVSALKGAREGRPLTLETSYGAFELDLRPHDLRAPGYRAVAVGADGVARELGRGAVTTYKASVRGYEGAEARLTLDGETIEGVVITPGGLFFIEPARKFSAAAGRDDFVFYPESSVRKESFGECGVTLAQEVGERASALSAEADTLEVPKGTTAEHVFGPQLQIDLATEADFEYFNFFKTNNPSLSDPEVRNLAINEIIGIMNQVDGIYNTQLGVRFQIVFQRVWEANNDPYTLTAAGSALDEFTDNYDGSFAPGAPPQRDLVHMWTGKDFNGSTIGIAWRPGLGCPDNSDGFGISQRFDIAPQKFVLTAHEIGHNLGAQHPNQLDVPPSDCNLTIMHASITQSTTFCQYSRRQMEHHSILNAACLTRLTPAGCTYSVTPAAPQMFAPGGGAGNIDITTGAGCNWGVVAAAPWISVTTNETGTGPGASVYTVAANDGGTRRANVEVAGRVFTVTQAASSACIVTPINYGQTLTGTLGSPDCRSGQPDRIQAFVDRYSFTGLAGQRVQVEMTATSQLDTFLYLIAPDGSVIAENDDIVLAQNTNSRIPPQSGAFFTLPQSGTYFIEATSFEDTAFDTGGYNITLTDGGLTDTVSFSSADYSVNEGVGGDGIGTEGVGFRTITVTRSGDLTTAASVNYATSDGTATRRRDYTQALGTLRFAPGEASKTFRVFITDDVFAPGAQITPPNQPTIVVESEKETVNLTLSNAVGTSLGTVSSAVLTINDNDPGTGQSPVKAASFSTPFFVRQHYLDFLNREPDSGGMNFWSNEIEGCGADQACREVKRQNVSAAFFLSIEFQETGYLVYRMYKSAFGDATSPGVAGTVPVIRLDEFLADTQRIGQGVVVGTPGWPEALEANKAAFAQEFVTRQRFLDNFPVIMTANMYVDQLIARAGATLTPAERQAIIDDVAANNNTAGRARALRAVAEHESVRQAERNRAFVLMQYFGYLRRNPDDAPDTNFGGWKFWLTKLDEFHGNFINAQMVKAFITSIEYEQRFGQ
ncbi:MAG TPA: zinc-dependent metalloprotease family protein [Pyrinomonadaceae bacterium]|nr:zinc-dependent metalloprotease family protein [Pyrinomonadaceae bacterium]